MRAPLPLTRLQELLDAYGANPERWPADERAAAEALLAVSPEARALRAAAARLDTALDLAAGPAAPSALLEQILARVPSRGAAASAATPSTRRATPCARPTPVPAPRSPSVGRARTWRLAAAGMSLAAVAALVLWLVHGSEPPLPTTTITVAEIGVYDAPTDVLLTAPGLDTLDDVPTFGCTGSGLGCLDAAPVDQQSALTMETYG